MHKKTLEFLVGGKPLLVDLDCRQEVSRVHPDILPFVKIRTEPGKTVLIVFETCFETVNHMFEVCEELKVQFILSRDFSYFWQLWEEENAPDEANGYSWESATTYKGEARGDTCESP